VLDRLHAAELLEISRVADQAAGAGAVSEHDRASWLADLQQRDDASRFFAALTGFLISACTR
jgi:hypothetical protein